MKNVLFALLLLSCFSGCGSTEDVSSIGLRSFSNSGCKTEIETRAANNASIADEETIEYYASSNGKLVVKHTNAIFGCESKVSAEAHMEKDNKTIVVNETATNEIANCICPYDLTMEVGELVDNNAYTIKIVHQGTTLLEENVTYTKDLQGKKTIRQAMRYDE